MKLSDVKDLAIVHKSALEEYEIDINADRDNIDKGKDDLRQVAGNQWSRDDRRQRDADGRVTLTVNKLVQVVRQVTGSLRQNRPAVKVRPADGAGDKKVSDIVQGIIRNVETRAKTRQPYLQAAINAAKCGIGHWRILHDYANDQSFEQDILLEPIPDPFAVVWDALATASTREDATRCFVTDRITKDEYEARWPDASIVDFDDMKGNIEWQPDSSDTVMIAEYWFKVDVIKTMAQLRDGTVVDITELDDKDGDDLVDNNGQPLDIIDRRDIPSHRVFMAIISGIEVLEKPKEFIVPFIPIIPVVGEETIVDGVKYRDSVIRHGKDPQRMYNYWVSTETEVVAMQPKAPYVATAKQISGNQAEWRNANRSNSGVLVYTPDEKAPGKPQREAPPQASSGLSQGKFGASEDIKATTGIFDASLGQRSNETSGIAINARKSQGENANFFISDNLASSVQHSAHIMVEMIPKIYDTERVVRILGEDGSEAFREINKVTVENGEQIVLNDLAAGKYDVDVSVGPSFNTRREEAASSMSEFARALPQFAPVIVDMIVANMDWPGADEMAKRLRKTLPPGIVEVDENDPDAQAKKQAQDQAQQQQQQLQEMQLNMTKQTHTADIAKATSEMLVNMAKTQQIDADADKKRIETAAQEIEVASALGARMDALEAMLTEALTANRADPAPLAANPATNPAQPG